MHHTGCVHGAECRQHRHKQLPCRIPGQMPAASLHKILQSDALIPLGNSVGSMIFLKNIKHRYNGGKFPQMGNFPGVIEKQRQRFLKYNLISPGNLHRCAVFASAAQALGKEFPDFYQCILYGITAYVCDTFPVCFLCPADNVPALQRSAIGQRMEHLGLLRVPSALGANCIPRHIGHASHTKIGFVRHMALLLIICRN